MPGLAHQAIVFRLRRPGALLHATGIWGADLDLLRGRFQRVLLGEIAKLGRFGKLSAAPQLVRCLLDNGATLVGGVYEDIDFCSHGIMLAFCQT